MVTGPKGEPPDAAWNVPASRSVIAAPVGVSSRNEAILQASRRRLLD